MAVVVVLTAAPFLWASRPRAAQDPSFDETAITRAREAVRADPLLRGEKTIKSLRWRERGEKPPAQRPGWFLWIAGFFAWLGQSARYVVWTGAAILAVLAARYVLAMAARADTQAGAEPFVAPTHVRDLDIRPASLPPDIGAAARAMWEAGQHRAALALLYRGLLSRLVHVHRVPIQDSTTEGDCLALSVTHLPAPRYDYASRLVRVWQRGVYGHEVLSAVAIHDLCDGFAAALDVTSTAPVTASGGKASA
jgi:hypothetical protein